MTHLAYFQECGLLENPVLVAHCVWIEESDIEKMKNNDVTPIQCISSNMKLGSGFAQIKHIHESGIDITLGTDGAASNNNLNFMEEIHLAAMVNKA